MNYKMFKIVSGEMIIAGIDQETDTDISINSPMVVHFAPSPSGQLAINLFPLNPFAKKVSSEMVIQKSHIIFCEEEVHEDIKSQYLEITSGIVTATNIPS